MGTAPDVAAELFRMMTGINFVVVRYRGTPAALTDLLGGQVQLMFDAVPTSIGHIRAGRLRALGVATASRLDALPSVPTVAETVPGYEAAGWCGICSPKDTPAEIVEKLNKEINAGLADFRNQGTARRSRRPRRSAARRRNSVNLSPTKPRNGPRW